MFSFIPAARKCCNEKITTDQPLVASKILSSTDLIKHESYLRKGLVPPIQQLWMFCEIYIDPDHILLLSLHCQSEIC